MLGAIRGYASGSGGLTGEMLGGGGELPESAQQASFR